MTETLRIATRESPLAMWQARHVATRLQALHPRLRVEVIGMTTKGDRILDAPLAKIGGKGLFVKELESGMLADQADIAVHSMKDVPVEQPEGLHLAVIMEREDPLDAFVSPRIETLEALPTGAQVGTSSLRRQCQLAARRPDLSILPLRGNLNTRLAKLDGGDYDAVILAAAGLVRLEMQTRIRHRIAPEDSLPAIGQGALGIECRSQDPRVNALIAPLNHRETAICVRAERAVNALLGGGCQVPIAGHATLAGERLQLRALVGMPDGSRVLRAAAESDASDPQGLGERVGRDLLGQGAGEILDSLQHT